MGKLFLILFFFVYSFVNFTKQSIANEISSNSNSQVNLTDNGGGEGDPNLTVKEGVSLIKDNQQNIVKGYDSDGIEDANIIVETGATIQGLNNTIMIRQSSNVTITNSGSIISLGSKAINMRSSQDTTITNNLGATITAVNNVISGEEKDSDSENVENTIITNSGTMYSDDARVIYLYSGAENVTITNNSSGSMYNTNTNEVIQIDTSSTITNSGTIQNRNSPDNNSIVVVGNNNTITLKDKGIIHQIVTNTPDSENIDKYVILGVNEKNVFEDSNFLISSGICDANAVAPVLNILNTEYEIEHGFLTTLHPWLSYQNLLDGPSRSFAYPGTIIENFALGRSSINAMIPKTTSAIRASEKVLKYLENKFQSLSFRVPTAIVSTADISVKLKKNTTKDEIVELFNNMVLNQKLNIIKNNYEPLVSTDFIGSEYSAIIDQRWTQFNDSNYLKLILWYDNEWAYGSRVVDLVNILSSQYNE